MTPLRRNLGFLTLLITLILTGGMLWITVCATWFTVDWKKALIGYFGCAFGSLLGVLGTIRIWETDKALSVFVGLLALIVAMICSAGLFMIILGITNYGQSWDKQWAGIPGFLIPFANALWITDNVFEDNKSFMKLLGSSALLIGIVNAGFFFWWWGGYMLLDRDPGDSILLIASAGYGFPAFLGIAFGINTLIESSSIAKSEPTHVDPSEKASRS